VDMIENWPALPPDRPCVRYCPACDRSLEAHEVDRCGVVHFCPDCGNTFHFPTHREGVDPDKKRLDRFAYDFTRRAMKAMGLEGCPPWPDLDCTQGQAEEFIKIYGRDLKKGRVYFWENWGRAICQALLEKEQNNGNEKER
jgi:hypothetical protein